MTCQKSSHRSLWQILVCGVLDPTGLLTQTWEQHQKSKDREAKWTYTYLLSCIFFINVHHPQQSRHVQIYEHLYMQLLKLDVVEMLFIIGRNAFREKIQKKMGPLFFWFWASFLKSMSATTTVRDAYTYHYSPWKKCLFTHKPGQNLVSRSFSWGIQDFDLELNPPPSPKRSEPPTDSICSISFWFRSAWFGNNPFIGTRASTWFLPSEGSTPNACHEEHESRRVPSKQGE